MPSRRTLTTPQYKGVVPTVTVIDGTVKCLAWTMNNAQLVQVSPLTKAPPERNRENMCPLNEGKETKIGNEASDRVSKEVRLDKLRCFLRTVATGHELGRKHSVASKTGVPPYEKDSIIRESQSLEIITNFISDEVDTSSDEEDLIGNENYISCEEEDPKTNNSILTGGREDSSSMSVSDTPKEEEEKSEAVRPFHVPFTGPMGSKDPEPPPWYEKTAGTSEDITMVKLLLLALLFYSSDLVTTQN